MNFVIATLLESKRSVVINMSHVIAMTVRKLYTGDTVVGTYTEIALVSGCTLEVTEDPAELINGVM
ncbi:MAG: hypothetical protein MJZ85_11005 [Bacteroidales bacterium]|nr:hypothetical protein [Bacteroidales bacterium]